MSTASIESVQGAVYIDGVMSSLPDRINIAVTDKATGEVIGHAAAATTADVDRAVTGARRAQAVWAATPGVERAAVMRRAAQLLERDRDRFVDMLIRESGSTRDKATGEFDASVIEFYQAADLATAPSAEIVPSGKAGRLNIIERRPVGLIGLITAWNAPLHIALRVLAPAIGLGNAVILKPAPHTPLVGGLMLAPILEQAGVPAAVVQILPGDAAGAALVEHPGVNMIHFTGSEATGRKINVAAAAQMKRVALELGGNNATVVLDDADLAEAARLGAAASFGHQGQVCIATSRHIVLASVAQEYTALLAEHARALRVGDPSTGPVDMGPLVSVEQAERAMALVARSVQDGGQVVEGGTSDGAFMRPTVVTGIRPGMALHDEETFAPIAPVIVVETEAQALEIVNGTRFALSAAVFSSDLDRAWNFADQVHAGMVHVNDMSALHESQVPFGGTGNSGVGERLGGRANIDLLTERRWTSLQRRTS